MPPVEKQFIPLGDPTEMFQSQTRISADVVQEEDDDTEKVVDPEEFTPMDEHNVVEGDEESDDDEGEGTYVILVGGKWPGNFKPKLFDRNSYVTMNSIAEKFEKKQSDEKQDKKKVDGAKKSTEQSRRRPPISSLGPVASPSVVPPVRRLPVPPTHLTPTLPSSTQTSVKSGSSDVLIQLPMKLDLSKPPPPIMTHVNTGYQQWLRCTVALFPQAAHQQAAATEISQGGDRTSSGRSQSASKVTESKTDVAVQTKKVVRYSEIWHPGQAKEQTVYVLNRNC